jgi:hypothetical protein
MNTLSLIMVGTIALSLGILYPMMSLAQEEQTGEQSQEQIEVPLNFSLKVPGDGNEQNATEGGKDVTVTLSIQSSEGESPKELQLTAKVSNDTKLQDLELCGTMNEGKEMCKSLGEVVKAQGENQTPGESSNETSTSGDSNDENNGNEDNRQLT